MVAALTGHHPSPERSRPPQSRPCREYRRRHLAPGCAGRARIGLWKRVLTSAPVSSRFSTSSCTGFMRPGAQRALRLYDRQPGQQGLAAAVAAAGETLVVLARGFDLSVAGVMSLTNVVMTTYPMEGPGGALLSFLLCMAVGGCVGAVNGYVVAVLRLQSIAATLGTMIMCQGLALVILDAPGGTVTDFVSNTLTDSLFGSRA